jgi:hypothetical protein
VLTSAEDLEKRFVAFTHRCVSRLHAGKTGTSPVGLSHASRLPSLLAAPSSVTSRQ